MMVNVVSAITRKRSPSLTPAPAAAVTAAAGDDDDGANDDDDGDDDAAGSVHLSSAPRPSRLYFVMV